MLVMELSRGMATMIDEVDEELFRLHKYHYTTRGYAARSTNSGEIYLHQDILQTIYIDHIDGNRLNNCRNNLRPSSNKLNQYNRGKPRGNYSSSYKGVSFCKTRNKWIAISNDLDNKQKNLGRYNTEIEAAIAYNKFVSSLYGEHVRLNEVNQIGNA